jgi:hypothetical protein
MDECIDNAWDDMVDQAIVFAALSNSNLLLQMMQSSQQHSNDDEEEGDHRQLPRAQRHQFKHQEALSCINRDYLGADPLFGKEFDLMFSILRQHFQKLLEDVDNSGAKFYLEKRNAMNREVASMEARLLLPLKTLAYGIAHHCFCDYFQMSRNLLESLVPLWRRVPQASNQQGGS